MRAVFHGRIDSGIGRIRQQVPGGPGARLSVPLFKRCFFIGLALLGLYMVVRKLHR